MNYSRPHLLYIDNIRRELKNSSDRLNDTGDKFIKPKSNWDKMAEIKLTDIEEKTLLEFIELISKHSELSVEWFRIFLSKGKGKQRKKILSEQDQVYSKLEKISDSIVALEAYNQLKGRKDGIFEWWNLLLGSLEGDVADQISDIADEVFNNSVKKLCLLTGFPL